MQATGGIRIGLTVGLIALWSLSGALLVGCGKSSVVGVHQQLVLEPPLDAQNRFRVYGETGQPAPFIPHGWMPEEAATVITEFDPNCEQTPYAGDRCLAITAQWTQSLDWCGVAWITKEQAEDGSPWWGQDPSGNAYDLTGAVELVVHARGEQGGERVQFKVGILGDKPDGDSTVTPIASDWVTLSTEWQTFTLGLAGHDLSRMVNGFTWVTSKSKQENGNGGLRVFLDDVYFQF